MVNNIINLIVAWSSLFSGGIEDCYLVRDHSCKGGIDTDASDIRYLRRLSDEAKQNDPVVGLCSYMPIVRLGSYRRCNGGECEIGNLFTDSLRWKANSDVAFMTSGGLRGMGWDEGEVRLSDIWAALPFPNAMCTGVMSGLSLFKLLDYSIRTATFESEVTSDGMRLLQISGMKVTYNTKYQGGDEHRILSIDIWDKDLEMYMAIERLKLYEFATDSFLCRGYDPFPDFLGANGNFTIDGEEPGVIGDIIHQNIVAEYLSYLTSGNITDGDNRTDSGNTTNIGNITDSGNKTVNETDNYLVQYYVGSIEGRLVNITDNDKLAALDLIHGYAV